MTAYFRPSTVVAAALAGLLAASAAKAVPAAKPDASDNPSDVVKVHDRDGRYHHGYHRHYYRSRGVVHAPFTRVEHGGHTVVDAPFAHVYSGRHGTHVVAPFVDYWD